MYYERSVVEEYPGAVSIIPGDLDETDCPNHGSLQWLVTEIATGGTGEFATTIIGGLAYTEATVAQLETECTIV